MGYLTLELTERQAVQERDAALRIQATFRGHKTRHKIHTVRQAATTIQRYVRGKIARNFTKERTRLEKNKHLIEEAARRRAQRVLMYCPVQPYLMHTLRFFAYCI
jgi:hypothetical protein